MNAVLLVPLAGPMQSWGTRSRFQERDTEREPSKSGVIGLLCAALGRDRAEPLDDLASLRMGVRVDSEGLLRRDFQTALDVITAEGKVAKDAQTSQRHYLADAVFLVGLEGDKSILLNLHTALSRPVWPLFLGRKSYVPSMPLYLPDGLREETDLRGALLSLPLLSAPKKEQEEIRLILESSSATHESRMDIPVSFAFGKREFRERYIWTETVPIDAFPSKEGSDVPFATRS